MTIRRVLPRLVGLTAALTVCFGVGVAVAETPLTIVDDSLPSMSAGEQFNFTFHAAGGAPPYLWSVDGKLPDGLSLSHDGVLSGRPAKSGPVTVIVILADSSHPSHPVTKTFQTAIVGSLQFEWLDPPKVNDNRIDGSVQVSNGSKDEFDLTVVIVAVAENGRATAIGYEHFSLKPGTTNFPITFGNTLAHGAYVIHADAIAEIPARNNILRQRLQTPGPLRIVAGP
ncbi:MAG: putative Ig domain-containing protein [Terriglobales bacterium]